MGNIFLSCSWDKTIKIWTKEQLKSIGTLKGHTTPVKVMALKYNFNSGSSISNPQDSEI